MEPGGNANEMARLCTLERGNYGRFRTVRLPGSVHRGSEIAKRPLYSTIECMGVVNTLSGTFIFTLCPHFSELWKSGGRSRVYQSWLTFLTYLGTHLPCNRSDPISISREFS
jgi:hypothetical protein